LNFAGFFALSVATHVGAVALLGMFPVDAPRPKEDIVEVSFVEQPVAPEPEPLPPAPEPVAPEPEPEPEPVKPPPKPIERAPKPAKAPPPLPDSTPPAAAEETIADFSGTTLTGQGGWASAVGSGAAMNGPIGTPGAAVTGRNRAGVAGGVVGGTGVRVVAEGDLSRRVQLPSADVLNAALERNYPKAARQQGIEGVARIRVRVFATGKLQPLSTINESYPGLADGCKKSLHDITFQPGLDRAGQPVATDITYKCDFRVQ
jgi:periplasmic protein TonB